MSLATRALRTGVDSCTTLVSWFNGKRRLRLPSSVQIVKINIGCGLDVAPGWINIDGSLNAQVAQWPVCVQRLSYRLSGSRQFYSEETYCNTLRNNVFVHHNLKYGL